MRPFNLRFLSGHGLLICCLLAAAARPASAEITPSRVFSDNVVLQRDAPLVVWGTSTAETKVTVEFANQVKSCAPEADGSWLVRLDPVAASGEPRDLVIRGAVATTVKNVLVGDVWIYAGGAETNRPATADIKLPEAGLPQVRVFAIGEATSRQVEADTKAIWAVPHQAPNSPTASTSKIRASAFGPSSSRLRRCQASPDCSNIRATASKRSG